MNAENRYPVTASMFMLREIKNRQEKVNKGYQLLKRKADALRMRGHQAANELVTTQAVLDHTLKEAYISLAAIKFTNGESNALVLENVDEAQIRVKRIPENISGVSTMSLQIVEDNTVNDALRYAGLGAGGHRTAETKKAFRKAIKLLITFASLRNTCVLLDEATKSTLRKINSIGKVILPKLHNTENYILTEMDEREREEFHRLKMVKAKKNFNQYLLKTNIDKKSIEGDIEESGPWLDLNEKVGVLDNQRTSRNRTYRDCSTNDIRILLTSTTCDLKCRNKIMLLDIKSLRKHGDYIYKSTMPSVSPKESLNSIANIYTGVVSSTSVSAGDFKPVCYPHNWDDEDLLF